MLPSCQFFGFLELFVPELGASIGQTDGQSPATLQSQDILIYTLEKD